MERYRPYGWGCIWHNTYCFRYSQDHEAACLKCHRLIGHEDEENWTKFLNERLAKRNQSYTERVNGSPKEVN